MLRSYRSKRTLWESGIVVHEPSSLMCPTRPDKFTAFFYLFICCRIKKANSRSTGQNEGGQIRLIKQRNSSATSETRRFNEIHFLPHALNWLGLVSIAAITRGTLAYTCTHKTQVYTRNRGGRKGRRGRYREFCHYFSTLQGVIV